jgi:hypothetical protein
LSEDQGRELEKIGMGNTYTELPVPDPFDPVFEAGYGGIN